MSSRLPYMKCLNDLANCLSPGAIVFIYRFDVIAQFTTDGHRFARVIPDTFIAALFFANEGYQKILEWCRSTLRVSDD